MYSEGRVWIRKRRDGKVREKKIKEERKKQYQRRTNENEREWHGEKTPEARLRMDKDCDAARTAAGRSGCVDLRSTVCGLD